MSYRQGARGKLSDIRFASNSEVRRCKREVCFARVSRHRQISRSGPVREESTLKPARSRKSLALRMHQVNTDDLQKSKGGCHVGSRSPDLDATPTAACPRHGDSSQRG